MKTLTRMGIFFAAASLAVSTASAAAAHDTGTQDSQEKPSWQQFKSDTFRDADGQYIVDGDIPVPDTASLFDFYGALPSGPVAADAPGGTGDLIANTDPYGNATLWSQSQARNLTYCVSNTFGARKSAVVDAKQRGAAMWESASPRDRLPPPACPGRQLHHQQQQRGLLR